LLIDIVLVESDLEEKTSARLRTRFAPCPSCSGSFEIHQLGAEDDRVVRFGCKGHPLVPEPQSTLHNALSRYGATESRKPGKGELEDSRSRLPAAGQLLRRLRPSIGALTRCRKATHIRALGSPKLFFRSAGVETTKKALYR
jgi:hypothetical protein